MITNSQMAKFQLIRKLASHFRIPTAQLKEDDRDGIISRFSLLRSTYSLSNEFYCGEGGKLNLMDLLIGSKFEKTDIYEHFLIGEGAANSTHHYVMSLYLKGHVWFIYRERAYNGPGAIYTSLPSGGGIVFEPAKTWLQHNFPVAIED